MKIPVIIMVLIIAMLAAASALGQNIGFAVGLAPPLAPVTGVMTPPIQPFVTSPISPFGVMPGVGFSPGFVNGFAPRGQFRTPQAPHSPVIAGARRGRGAFHSSGAFHNTGAFQSNQGRPIVIPGGTVYAPGAVIVGPAGNVFVPGVAVQQQPNYVPGAVYPSVYVDPLTMNSIPTTAINPVRTLPTPGTSRAAVIEQFGNPSVSIMTRDGETLQFHGGVVVRLQNGVVVSR